MEKKKIAKLLLLIVLLLLVVLLVVFYLRGHRPASAAAPTPKPTPTPTVIVQEVERVVEVKAEVTAEEIGSGLKDLGKMTTAEYIFTGIASAEKPPQSFLGMDIGFTGASFHASYNGTVTAGIDFGKITVEKNEEEGSIIVGLPPAEIQNVDIDLESFRLISEESRHFAHITPEEFNTSQVALEAESRDRAIELKLLEKADENAGLLVRNFVRSLVGTAYTVRIVPAE